MWSLIRALWHSHLRRCFRTHVPRFNPGYSDLSVCGRVPSIFEWGGSQEDSDAHGLYLINNKSLKQNRLGGM